MSRTRSTSLTTIALACGFSSSSDFSRCFKQRFGVSPRSFDIKAWREAHGDKLNAIVGRPPSSRISIACPLGTIPTRSASRSATYPRALWLTFAWTSPTRARV